MIWHKYNLTFRNKTLAQLTLQAKLDPACSCFSSNHVNFSPIKVKLCYAWRFCIKIEKHLGKQHFILYIFFHGTSHDCKKIRKWQLIISSQLHCITCPLILPSVWTKINQIPNIFEIPLTLQVIQLCSALDYVWDNYTYGGW